MVSFSIDSLFVPGFLAIVIFENIFTDYEDDYYDEDEEDIDEDEEFGENEDFDEDEDDESIPPLVL